MATNDATIAARLQVLRDGLQAAILRHKLIRLDAWTTRRRALAERYRRGLAGLPLQIPAVYHRDHVVVRTPQRDALREHLQRAGIETGLHYPVPLQRQPCLAHLVMDRDSFTRAEQWGREGLSLPAFYGMSDGRVDRIIRTMRELSFSA